MTAETKHITGTYQVTKSDDAMQIIFGWFSVADHTDGSPVVDSHHEFIKADELERAAYAFVLKSGESGEDHDPTYDTDGVLVESMMFTVDKFAALAVDPFTGDARPEVAKFMQDNIASGWWGAFWIEDTDAYNRAKTEKSAFSIEGRSRQR